MAGIQGRIDELAKTPEFVEALQNEVAARKLTLKNVTACIGSIYNSVAKHGEGNDFVIAFHEDHYTSEECAVLTTLLHVQSGWPGGLKWTKVTRRRKARC